MKQLTRYDFDIHKNFSKRNNPANHENGCDWCKGAFTEDEVFVRIDERGWDGVWSFHKGECHSKGFNKLLAGDTLGFDYGVPRANIKSDK